MYFKKEKGQAMAEFALIMPVLILLLLGMTFAAFYAFRSASTDWGVFITGIASGSYNLFRFFDYRFGFVGHLDSLSCLIKSDYGRNLHLSFLP